MPVINSHPRDADINFIEDTHTYIYKGEREFISVTTVIHKYFPEFDADKIIPIMMKSHKWPQSPYYGMTPDEIKAAWEKNRNEAAQAGTKMHKTIEAYFRGEPVAPELRTKEFKLFLSFWKDYKLHHPDHEVFRVEWWVYDEDIDLAGAMDIVLIDGEGALHILDWKRSKAIKFENQYERGQAPFDDMDNCNANHYFLQLNFYRHMLINKYGSRVKKMKLVILHPDQDQPIIIRVPKIKLYKYWPTLTKEVL